MLDNICSNYGIFRFAATNATGQVLMGRNELLDNDKTIVAGTTLKTLDGKEYTIDTTTVMSAPGASYYSVTYRRYLIPFNITASDIGTAGNTVSNTITTIVGSISGINYVTNPASISNGQDAETNDQLISRLRTILSGNNFGTVDGYRNLIMNNFRDVKDVIVIPPGDSLMLRDNGSGGMVDIYVLVENPSISVTSTFSGFNKFDDGSGYSGVLLPLEPVDSNITPAMPATGVFVPDTGTLEGSYAEQSYVSFPTQPSKPFDITYNYFKIIPDIQNFLNLSANCILGNTILQNNAVENIALVKSAIKRLINISVKIAILPGFDSATVILACQTAINDYVSALGLNANLPQSDIVAVLENVPGVDFVDLPFSIYNFINGTVNEVDDIVPAKNEYLRINSLQINV
jgi:hypothetical protein